MAVWRVFAHRGARAHAPENSWTALVLAQQSGAHGWETDVRLTRDLVPVLVHDHTLYRTSDWAVSRPARTGLLSRLSFSDLLGADFGSWFASQDPFGTVASGAIDDTILSSLAATRVLRLETALAFAAKHDFLTNIELKDQYGVFADRTVVNAVLEAVHRSGIPSELVLFSSFRPAYLRLVRDLAPQMKTALLAVRTPPRVRGVLRKLGAAAYHPHREGLSSELVQQLRGDGFDVHVFTVNTAVEAHQWHAAGASGIFTDFPRQMVQTFSSPSRPPPLSALCFAHT